MRNLLASVSEQTRLKLLIRNPLALISPLVDVGFCVCARLLISPSESQARMQGHLIWYVFYILYRVR